MSSGDERTPSSRHHLTFFTFSGRNQSIYISNLFQKTLRTGSVSTRTDSQLKICSVYVFVVHWIIDKLQVAFIDQVSLVAQIRFVGAIDWEQWRASGG